jgi:hypothetical protein
MDTTKFQAIWLAPLVLFSWPLLHGQELEPRAYASAPVGVNGFLVGFTRSSGGLVFDPTIPVEDVSGDLSGTIVGFFQSVDFFGRYANFTVTLPYTWGPLEGLVNEEFAQIRRSGLGSPRFRYAFNLVGAPALSPKEFAAYRQKTNLGVSLTVTTPLGQYDPVKLINLGTNRWAFKPELGFSHVKGRWVLEAAAGTWFFGANDRFLGDSTLGQSPVVSLQGHLIYNLPRQMWVGFDANYFGGGEYTVNGESTDSTDVTNSRLGATFAFPVKRRHLFKVVFSDGFLTTRGSDFTSLSVVYQVVWLSLRRQ